MEQWHVADSIICSGGICKSTCIIDPLDSVRWIFASLSSVLIQDICHWCQSGLQSGQEARLTRVSARKRVSSSFCDFSAHSLRTDDLSRKKKKENTHVPLPSTHTMLIILLSFSSQSKNIRIGKGGLWICFRHQDAPRGSSRLHFPLCPPLFLDWAVTTVFLLFCPFPLPLSFSPLLSPHSQYGIYMAFQGIHSVCMRCGNVQCCRISSLLQQCPTGRWGDALW